MNTLITRNTWLLLTAISALHFAVYAQGASFDCGKAGTKVEHLICNDPRLSKLDEELATNYKTAQQDKAHAKALQRGQMQWLKEVDHCKDAECVSWSYAARIVALQNMNASFLLTQKPTKQKVEQDCKAGFKGEYFLAKGEDLVCVPFTQNLNQFRKLDFDECHPRLSEKFPEFSRPEWKEVPLDLEIAEKAFKDSAGEKLKPGEGIYWRNWLSETAELRAAGKVTMWLTDVDINHDGIPDPIARVQYAHPASSLPVKQRGCVYSHSGLRFLLPPPENFFGPYKHFYFGRDADIIYSSATERHYSVEWSEGQVGPILDGQKIGATRGVLVELSREAHSSPVPVCYINWVPTGSYRPLQRKTNSPESVK